MHRTAATQSKSCAMSNVSYKSGAMSADMTCTGAFTGHMQFVWDSDEHYTGEMSMTGTSGGRSVTRSQKFEGRWLSAQCPAQHP